MIFHDLCNLEAISCLEGKIHCSFDFSLDLIQSKYTLCSDFITSSKACIHKGNKRKRSKNKRQTSKKMFDFTSVFARCEFTLIGQVLMLNVIKSQYLDLFLFFFLTVSVCSRTKKVELCFMQGHLDQIL